MREKMLAIADRLERRSEDLRDHTFVADGQYVTNALIIAETLQYIATDIRLELTLEESHERRQADKG